MGVWRLAFFEQGEVVRSPAADVTNNLTVPWEVLSLLRRGRLTVAPCLPGGMVSGRALD